MSDIQRQAALRPGAFGRSTFSNPSLVSPTTPTLANPVRGFGIANNSPITNILSGINRPTSSPV